MNSAPIIDVLIEVESAVSYIEQWVPEAKAEAALATKYCDEIRDAWAAGDVAAASMAACQLGERLAEIRRLGKLAYRLADRDEDKNNEEQRAYEKANERCAVFFAERKRTFSDAEAYRRAAAKLGVNVKTVRRAVSKSCQVTGTRL
jgi:hypothetical protein